MKNYIKTIFLSVQSRLTITLFCMTAFNFTIDANSSLVPLFATPKFQQLKKACHVVIVIPAYNEEMRLEKTLNEFFNYFAKCKNLTTTFLVVCNNCSDDTPNICKVTEKNHPNFHYLNLKPGGKGFAVKQGFLKALEYKNVDYIGFVDADLATTPPYFYELIYKIQNYDGAIASRYKQGARVWPNRPFVKKMGGQFYNWVLRHRFHFDIRDTQCGAKLFTRDAIAKIAPEMKETGWAFDLELLYLCQLFDFNIIEIPTTWTDAPGSHLTISGSYKEFITSPTRIKNNHEQLAKAQKIKQRKAHEEALKQQRLEKKHHHHESQFLASK
ncbi:MAG: glycosyltransferase [Candidatus Chromulinivorax sp.]